MLIILGAGEKGQRKIFCHLYLKLCSKTCFSVFSIENSSSSIILRKIMNYLCAVQNVNKKEKNILSSKMKKSIKHWITNIENFLIFFFSYELNITNSKYLCQEPIDYEYSQNAVVQPAMIITVLQYSEEALTMYNRF